MERPLGSICLSRIISYALLCPTIVLAGCGPTKRPTSSLTITDVRLDGRKLSFNLANNADLRITASTLEIQTEAADVRTSSAKWTIDWYTSAADSTVAPLQPRHSRRETIAASPSWKVGSALRLSVAAVVFDDTSASGDSSLIEAIFRRRSEDRQELTRLVDEYTAALELHASVPAVNVPAILAAIPVEKRRAALSRVQKHLRGTKQDNNSALLTDLRKMFATTTTNADGDIRALQRLWNLYQAALRHGRRGD